MKKQILIYFILFLFIINLPASGKTDNFSKGLTYYYGGNWNKALAEFEKVLKNDGNNHMALFYKSQVLLKKGSPSKALEPLKKAVSLKPDRVAYLYKLTDLYTILKDKKNLTETWTNIKKLLPDNPEPYYKLAGLYIEMNNISQGISELDSALKLDPNPSGKSYYKLAMLYLKNNQLDKSLENFNKYFAGSKDPETYLLLGYLFYERGNMGLALDYYNKVISIAPYKTSINKKLAYLYYSKNDYASASIYLDNILYMNPGGQNYYNLGCILYLREKFTQAKEMFIKAVEYDKNNSVYHYNLGCTYFKLGNYDGALIEFSKAADKEPGNKTYTYALGCIHYLRKDFNDSVKKFKGITNFGKQMDGCINMGITYRDRGRVDIPIQPIKLEY